MKRIPSGGSSTTAIRKSPEPPAAGQAPGPSSSTPPAEPTKQSVLAAGLNAIAVLTNHPNKAPTRIHRNELPTVPRTHYPRIKRSDFDEYLESVAALFEQYEANTKSGYQIAADELDRYEAAVEDAEKVLEAASHTYSMDSTTMAERLKALDGTRSEFGLESMSEYGGGDVSTTGKANSLLGIEDIPTIFFEEKFDLRDPAMFDIATQVVLGPQTATAGLFSPERSVETSANMHETLSGYMDTVEAYLTREISRRSPSFFAALSTLEELHAETDRCIEKIHVLRNDLRKTAHAQCSPGLELIRLRRRRDSLSVVLNDVDLLSNFKHIQPTINELVSSGDCIGALNLIVEAQEMVGNAQQRSRKSRSRHVGGRQRKVHETSVADTKAFKLLNARMLKSLRSVASYAEQELAAIVLRDMREFVDDGLSNSSDGLLSRSQVDIYQVNLSMQLTPFICGLVRTGGLGGALKMYRDNLMAETAGLIENLYPSGFPRSQGHAMFNDATQQRALGAAVRGLTFDQFRALLRQQQEVLLLVISHISMVRRAILEVAGESPPLSKCYDSAKSDVLRSLNEAFDAFMDVAHVRCAKLLNHRSEQNARLSLAGFYSLYASIWQFISKYEELGGKMCFGLRGTLTAQAKAFLSNFHTEKSRQIQILIENEQWVQAEVPIDFQNLVNQVVDAATVSGDEAGLPPSHMLLAPKMDSDAASIRSVDTAGIGLMHIGDEAFHVVGCSLVLVKSVVEYLQCAVNIPMLVTDVLQRLVEVFKSFNSRTCQVVLGAGAMRSAGLKNISAKHIALASESLSLCMELLPYVKECLRHVMSPSQEVLLSQLDRTVSDFGNHQQELHRKLVSIMTDRADYHCRMLNATKWDELDHSAQPPVPAMDAMVKEVRKLHKVLKRYLPPSTLRSVFAQIFKMYEAKLTAQYRRLRITSGEGKRQLMLNSQYLLRRLRALDSSLPVDWELEVVVNNIDLVKPYQHPTSPVPASSSVVGGSNAVEPGNSGPASVSPSPSLSPAPAQERQDTKSEGDRTTAAASPQPEQ
ncbi:Vps54-domain-containing protein [Martensiomyces pterosporus]|nr:Vps54-domain-containing protein [Martensiomyces pterosporus]